MKKEYADLEIGVHRRDADRYQIELRFDRPDSDTEDQLARGKTLYVQFDMEGLDSLKQDDDAYGKLLGESLFAAQEALVGFEKARTVAQTLETPLRVRLFIGPSAPELHRLRWETLSHPQ